MVQTESVSAALICIWIMSLTLSADVIYLTDGNVLVVEKAWEEASGVKYQTAGGVRSLTKASVQRIQTQKPAQPPGASPRKYGIAVEYGVRQNPGSTQPLMNLPTSQGSKEISDDVIRRLKENVKSDPNDLRAKTELIQTLNSMAMLQRVKGDLKGAKESLQQALSFDKRQPATLSNLAIIYYLSGDYRSSEDLLLNLLQVSPKDQFAHYLLGEAYYAQDKISLAINEWKAALQFKPDEMISSRLEKAQKEAGAHNELGVLQSAHFILRYDRQVSDYRLGQQILTSLESIYRQLSIDLVSEPPETVAVILYPDQAYFNITQAPRWTGAIYDGKIRVPIKGLSAITSELTAVLTHELTHSFISSIGGSHCPTWFNEGLAQFQEGKSASEHKKTLAHLLKQNQLIPFENLKGSFMEFSSATAGLAYTQGLSAVECLVALHGRSALRNILSLLRQNYNFESALKSVTKQSQEEFEKAWQVSLN